MNQTDAPLWDCRWPDSVAIQVASERILKEMLDKADAAGVARPDLNLDLRIQLRMEVPADGDNLAQGLLVTPWGVERIFWDRPGRSEPPPIESAYPLDADENGRVAKGQGVLLMLETGLRPVLIGWEPETGHHFVETLLHSVLDIADAEEAFSVAIGLRPPPTPRERHSLSGRMRRPVSRRQLFGLFRDREPGNGD